AATTEATQPAFAALHQDDDADKADRQENLDHADDGVDDLGHWESFGSRAVAAGFLNRLRWDFQRRFPVMDERVTQPSPGFGGAFWRGSTKLALSRSRTSRRDPQEVRRLQAGAADQGAVDLRHRHQL